MSKLKAIVAASTLVLVSAGVFAQDAATATPRADKREAVQNARIQQGVNSGQLNANEANRLSKQEAAVGNMETKAKADGTVTKGERATIHHVQKKTSRRIDKQSHDGNTAATPQ